MGDKYAVTAISVLFERVRPSAIMRRISLIVVNPVYGEPVSIPISKRPLKKCVWVFIPFSTNSNSASTIIGIARIVLVVAPCHHAIENVIDTLISVRFGKCYFWNAMTTFCACSACKAITRYIVFITAQIASASPSDGFIWG